MKIKVIKNEKEHQAALKVIESLWSAKPGTPQGDKLDLLATLVESYEAEKHRVLPPHAVEAIKFRMEQENLSKADLAKVLGGRNRVSEVMNRKRALTVNMMRNLHRKLHIPAESLLAA
jgi:HTH-type transcriptional regulator / antitoxin HigA